MSAQYEVPIVRKLLPPANDCEPHPVGSENASTLPLSVTVAAVILNFNAATAALAVAERRG